MVRSPLALTIVMVLNQVRTVECQWGHLQEADRVIQRDPGGRDVPIRKAEIVPFPYGPPVASYLQNVSHDAKKEYFEIIDNKMLTINQQKLAILEWASKHGLKAQVQEFHDNMAMFKEEIKRNLTAVASELSDTLRTLFILTESEDETPTELNEALRNFLAKNSALNCVIEFASGKSKGKQQESNSSNPTPKESVPESEDVYTTVGLDSYKQGEVEGSSQGEFEGIARQREQQDLEQTGSAGQSGVDDRTAPHRNMDEEDMENFENADELLEFGSSKIKSGQNDQRSVQGYEGSERIETRTDQKQTDNIDQITTLTEPNTRQRKSRESSASESEEGFDGYGHNRNKIGIMDPRTMDQSYSEQSKRSWGSLLMKFGDMRNQQGKHGNGYESVTDQES